MDTAIAEEVGKIPLSKTTFAGMATLQGSLSLELSLRVLTEHGIVCSARAKEALLWARGQGLLQRADTQELQIGWEEVVGESSKISQGTAHLLQKYPKVLEEFSLAAALGMVVYYAPQARTVTRGTLLFWHKPFKTPEKIWVRLGFGRNPSSPTLLDVYDDGTVYTPPLHIHFATRTDVALFGRK